LVRTALTREQLCLKAEGLKRSAFGGWQSPSGRELLCMQEELQEKEKKKGHSSKRQQKNIIKISATRTASLFDGKAAGK